MLRTQIRVTLAAVAAAAILRAQPPSQSRVSTDAAARQRAARDAMERSLTRQRGALAKQTGQAEQSGFFLLSPPSRMGAAVPAPATADCEPLPLAEIESLVDRSSKTQDVDKELLRGVMREESAFRPCAISSKGAMGLMQLMPSAVKDLGVHDPCDPADNVEGGAAYLKRLLVRYAGDLPLALGAYNAGITKVDAAAGVPKIPETEEYVKRILSALPVKH